MKFNVFAGMVLFCLLMTVVTGGFRKTNDQMYKKPSEDTKKLNIEPVKSIFDFTREYQ